MAKQRRQARARERERRRELDELKRRQRARERRFTIFAIAGAVLIGAALVALAAIVPNLGSGSASASSKPGHQNAPNADEKAAGCTGVHNDHPSKGGLHTTDPVDYTKYKKYSDIPPTSGYHNPVTLGTKTRFYPLSVNPRPERAVHNLEHGFVVAWYDDKLPATQVQQLQQLAQDPSLSKLLVVGWTRGSLPNNKHVVLTSWGRTDRCSTVSSNVVREFYTTHVDASIAPEHGVGIIPNSDLMAPDKLVPPSSVPTTHPTASASSSSAASPSPTGSSP